MRLRSNTSSGLLLAAYLVTVPSVMPLLWHRVHQPDTLRIATYLVVGLGALWAVVVLRLGQTIWRQRRGYGTRGGFGWLAGLLLSLASVIVTPLTASAANTTPTAHHAVHRTHQVLTSTSSTIPLALFAKRRRDELKQLRVILEEGEVEHAIEELRSIDQALIQKMRDALPEYLAGVVSLSENVATSELEASPDSPVLVIPVREDRGNWTLAYARPGGTIVVHEGSDVQELGRQATALHSDGLVVSTFSTQETLRALALRPSTRVMVFHLSDEVLDEDIAALCVSLTRRAGIKIPQVEPEERYQLATAVLDAPTVMVRLLGPQAEVDGLVEPFNADLRRRCVEMTSYLAIHRHEPVTGDRLRTRVLGDGYSDASTRTLANTASAVRRSLGSTGGATRLLPVSPGGHYRSSDLGSDVEQFHNLVATARRSSTGERHLLTEAISLIRGEPLAAELRGFEWFLAEGHLARLQRDAEWAALRLARLAIEAGDVDVAYFALERGRLVDPYSDDIVAALARVPRRRN